MRLVCPSCEAVYEVPEAVVGDGSRRMRCARCQKEWTAAEAFPAPPAARLSEAAAELDARGRPPAGAAAGLVAEHEAPPAPPPPSAVLPPLSDLQWPPIATPDPARQLRDVTYGETRPRRFAVALLGWVLTVVTICVVVGAAYIWRGEIMRAWPPSERVYAAVGLH